MSRILVGTHHKTGTVLMKNIFEKISESLGIKMLDCSGTSASIDDNWDIIYDHHSTFNGVILNDNLKGIHMIRDPRMIIVSSAFYHMKSSEAWLHQPIKRFSDMTYHEKINSLSSDRERFLFEMDHGSSQTIRDMESWIERRYCWSLDIKLEELMVDVGFDVHFKMFRHIGLSGLDLIKALEASYAESVFNPEKKDFSHIRSRSPESLDKYFDGALHDSFKKRFGNVCEKLGYA